MIATASAAVVIADLPSDIAILNGIVQGVLVHSDWLTAYGLDDAHYRNRITRHFARCRAARQHL
jgi:hypothetical protein